MKKQVKDLSSKRKSTLFTRGNMMNSFMSFNWIDIVDELASKFPELFTLLIPFKLI